MDALALATRDLLDRSRAEGRRRVNAVRRPLIVIAVALLLPAFASVGAFAVLGDGPFDDMPLIGMVLGLTGFACLLSASLPEDRTMPYALCAIAMAISSLLVALDTSTSPTEWAHARAECARARGGGACALATAYAVTVAQDAACGLLIIARLSLLVYGRVRVGPTPRRAWLVTLSTVRAGCTSYVAMVLARGIIDAVHAGEVGAIVIMRVCVACWLFFIAAVLLAPSTIRRIHAWLERRGEAANSAAAIATLIGGSRTPAETLDEGVRTLRGVPADRLRPEHFQPPRASSSTLLARLSRASARTTSTSTRADVRREGAARTGWATAARPPAAAACTWRALAALAKLPFARSPRERARAAGCAIAPLPTPGVGGSPRASTWPAFARARHAGTELDAPPRALERADERVARGSFLPLFKLRRASVEPATADRASALAEPPVWVHARYGEVDCFISHSWSDSAERKWEAVQAWRAHFKAAHGREPILWLDRLCIDQSAIATSIQLLPIYLSACSRMLCLAGETYLSRLWCLIELFVFVETGGSAERIDVRFVTADGGAEAIGAVDVRTALCSNAADADRLRATIEASFAGAGAFNARMTELIGAGLARPSARTRADDRTKTDEAGPRVL